VRRAGLAAKPLVHYKQSTAQLWVKVFDWLLFCQGYKSRKKKVTSDAAAVAQDLQVPVAVAAL